MGFASDPLVRNSLTIYDSCRYIAYNTFKVIVRFYVMASILILPMALLIALGLSRADFSYIFPITEAGWWNIIQASKETITAMYGFEIILIAFPRVNGSSVAKLKAISIANGFVTLFILLLFGFAISYLAQNKSSLFRTSCLLITLLTYRDYRPDGFTIHTNMDDNSCGFYC